VRLGYEARRQCQNLQTHCSLPFSWSSACPMTTARWLSLGQRRAVADRRGV